MKKHFYKKLKCLKIDIEKLINQSIRSIISIMEFKTCFSSVCESGYKIDVVKSGMQKYLRRREAVKMKWCANELYKFRFGEKENEKQIGKGIFSNLINRIIVMLDEELSFDEVARYALVYKSIEDLRKEENYDNGVAILYRICDVLCCGNLIRITSDICGFYNKRIFMDKVEVNVDEMVYPGDVECSIFIKSGESEEYKSSIKNFVGHFHDKNPNVYYWLFRIMNMDGEGVKTRYRRKEYIYGVWEFLESLIGENESLRKGWENRIKEFHNKAKNERKMFLVAAVNVFMYRDEIDFEKEVVYHETGVINEKKMKIDEYCIDMHCSLGRVAGKNRKDFAVEGCFVADEYVKYKVDEWRAYYIGEKLKDVAIQKKIKKSKIAEKVPKVEEEVPIKKIKSKKVPNFEIVGEEEVPVKKIKKSKKVEIAAGEEVSVKKIKSKKAKELSGMKLKLEDMNKKLDFIHMDDLEFVKLCSNTTCGNKVMCFIVKYKGNLFVLKEGRVSMNYNYDYDMLDKCKEVFGLNKIGMTRIRSNKIIEKINKSEKYWENNFHFVEKNDVVYVMMNLIDGVKFIDYRRKVGEENVSQEMWSQYMKIGLLRGIFMVSDFSQINVMVDKCNQSYSIDEHDVLGKREYIVGDKNMKIYKMHQDKINGIMDDLYMDQEEKKGVIRNVMKSYLFEEDKINQVIANYDSLRERFSNEYDK